MNTATFLLNLLYPPKCLSCGELLWPNAETPLCPKCRAEWDKLRKSPCGQCKRPHEECRCIPPILRDLRVDARHIVPYQRDTVAGRLLLIVKDERLPALTDFFADELVPLLTPMVTASDRSDLLITYLPRGRRNALTSGVDQGRALAKTLAKRLDLPVIEVFSRRNSTAQKENDTMEQRLRSARRSYRLKKRLPDLSGKRMILVDDIFTSGATMIAGAELLRSKGVKDIYCVTVGKSEKTTPKQPK